MRAKVVLQIMRTTFSEFVRTPEALFWTYGFPLVMAVRDQTSFDQVLRNGWDRLNNSPTQEHATALIEIAKIAAHRFDELVANANPIHSARTRHLES